jgi:hypothetical protein
VLDEAGEMEEFPPRAMTADETYMEGHGVFKASASEYITWIASESFDTRSICSWYSSRWIQHRWYYMVRQSLQAASHNGCIG